MRVPAGSYLLGQRVPPDRLRRGTAVEVNGQAVGTALPIGVTPDLNASERAYLARTNQALLKAAVLAVALALVLSVLLARTFTRPLRELTAAARGVARGELKQEVPVRSGDELGELAAAFNQMTADLARAVEARRQMTADIAHDLRTPLTVVTGYLEALRDGVLPPTQQRFETMYNEARHLQRLVEDLRTLSLADAGELRLDRAPVAPDALLERLAAAYRLPAEQRGIALQVQAAGGLPEIDVDVERMMQVLGNLVSNALRYTPEGGRILLTAKRQQESTPRGDGAVVLTVEDSGAGIAPEALPNVFDRFYRGEESRYQQNGESGLGLAIARSIIAAHGGTISASSPGVGLGATFTILVPPANRGGR